MSEASEVRPEVVAAIVDVLKGGDPADLPPGATAAELRSQAVAPRDEAAGGRDGTGHRDGGRAQPPEGTPKRRTYSSWAPAGRAS